MEFININIIKNPINWIIVLLMLMIFMMFGDLLLRHYGDLHVAADPQFVPGQ